MSTWCECGPFQQIGSNSEVAHLQNLYIILYSYCTSYKEHIYSKRTANFYIVFINFDQIYFLS